MAKNCETGQTARQWRWLWALMTGSLGLGVAFFTGCAQTPVVNAPQPADPLHGVLTPPGMPQPTSAPKVGWNPPPSQQFGDADSSSTNNATLASKTWQGSGPLGKPLAIDDSNKGQAPGQLTTGSKSQTEGYLAPNPSPKIQPVPDANPANPPLTPTGSWQPASPNPPIAVPDAPIVKPVTQTVANSAPAVNPDVLGKQLQDRGVINQKVDNVPAGVKLTCYVARVGGAGFRVLEATAVDYNSAAQAIIQQIDTAPQHP